MANLFEKIKQRLKPKPLTASIIFECEQRCNLTCKYCYNVWNLHEDYPQGQLSTDETKLLLAKAMRQSHTRHVTFTGGEPYLRKDLMDLMAYCKTIGANMNVITNGTLLDKQTIEDTMKRGIRLFEIQLPSVDRAITEELMGPDVYDTIVNSIAQVKSAGGSVVTVVVLNKRNLATLAETYRLFFALGVRGVMLNRMNPGGRGTKYVNELMPGWDEMTEALDISAEAAEKYKLWITTSIPMMPCVVNMDDYKDIGYGFCAAGTERSYFTMDPLGNLRVCNHTSRILGNLRETSFKKLAAKGRDFYDAKPDYCLKCSFVNACLGGCKAAAEETYGCITDCEPYLKRAIEEGKATPPEEMVPMKRYKGDYGG
ncbi:MAG: radical SAM protein [bacterium]|nr:radical SAM protein [bacterium]